MTTEIISQDKLDVLTLQEIKCIGEYTCDITSKWNSDGGENTVEVVAEASGIYNGILCKYKTVSTITADFETIEERYYELLQLSNTDMERTVTIKKKDLFDYNYKIITSRKKKITSKYKRVISGDKKTQFLFRGAQLFLERVLAVENVDYPQPKLNFKCLATDDHHFLANLTYRKLTVEDMDEKNYGRPVREKCKDLTDAETEQHARQ
ncbi:hypothetical protein HELRODRAFT_161658 [Helobdella robusta]|uniref:Ciliogenesis-associated TTC17-interacting protein N-terminal domain-containing protein n=1 Tax=Helobdella robusta TaxID=6412 RepID=T1ERR3_HELRO|nr:hypothetical protein HELRODRAFT_161658 [Helobdella robusta]ESO02393.1 hypothetical protein HELRODRAFT_161658 [Helobdella robusta]